jgi:hypothetical protein
MPVNKNIKDEEKSGKLNDLIEKLDKESKADDKKAEFKDAKKSI